MTFNAVGVDTSFKAFAPTCADGYKIGHAALYPKGTDFAYGNCTPRSDKLFLKSESVSKLYDHKVVWVGVQGVLREVHGLWQRTFFGIPKERAVSRYKRTMKAYLGNENANAEYLGRLWDVGYLPVTVLSIDEGERLDIGVPGYVIYATGEHFWIYNYLETIMSSLLWKIVTNATIAYEYRRVFDAYAKETGVDPSFAAIQGHDFSFRGVGGYNDAASSGFGHLVSFAGTDTIPAIDYAEEMYGADVEKGAVEVLWDAFGGTVTEKGFKVLCDKIGLIYGDSITVKRAEEILRRLKKKGFASCNTVFGIGSYTYQYSTRDLFGIAMKATACRVNGEVIELYKAPATETNTLKKSAKGFLKVVKEGDNFKLLQQQDISVDSLMHESGELKPVYQNGVFLNPVTHSVLRARLLK